MPNKDRTKSTAISPQRQAFMDRLQQCVDKAGSVARLSKVSRISAPTIWDYLYGKSDPTREKVIALADASGVSVAWLAAGEGSVESGSVKEQDFAVLPLIAPFGAKMLEGSSSHFSYNKEWLARAGYDIRNLATALVTDDTMAPGIPSHSTVIFDRRQVQASTGVFVVSIGGRTEVKRLQSLTDGRVKVISDNPQYPPFDISPADASDFKIAGRAIAVVDWRPL